MTRPTAPPTNHRTQVAGCVGKSVLLAVDDPAEATLPIALALALAVADYDEAAVTKILANLDREQMRALAIVLAAHVDLDKPITTEIPDALTPDEMVRRSVNITAALFETHPEVILSRDNHRQVTDARAVAMSALRLLGLSSPYIGGAFGRDHTTVLYACGRVGEDGRLRRLSVRVAEQLGWDRNAEDVAS